jgi:hypothetical protein
MPLALLLGLLCLVYWPSSLSLWSLWFDPAQGYGHGLVTTLLTIYFVTKRANSFGFTQPNRWTLLSIVCLSLLWTISYLTHSQSLHQTFFVLQIATVFYCAQSAPKTLLPWFLLSLCTPVWNILNPLLQTLAIHITTFWLQGLHIPAYIVGEKIQLPYGGVMIAGGCSGLRYLLVALALASSYALLHALNRRHSLLLMLIAASCALLMNWFRIAMVIAVGYATDMQHPWVQDHNVLGWIIFAVTMLPVIIIGKHFPSSNENNRQSTPTPSAVFKKLLFALLLIPLLGYGLWLNSWRIMPPPRVLPSVLDDAFSTTSHSNWQLQMFNADIDLRATYHPANNSAIEVRVAGYTHQSQAHELDYVDNTWLPDWPVITRTHDSAVLRGPDGLYQVLWWYEIAGDKTTDLKKTKWLAFKRLLNLPNPRQDAVIIVLLQKANTDKALRNMAQQF